MSKNVKIVLTLFICISIVLIVGVALTRNITEEDKTGKYVGISEDNKWMTYFNVISENNELLLKGELICLDKKLLDQYNIESIKKNIVTIENNKGKSFGGNLIYNGDGTFAIITYAKENGYQYKKMTITIDSELTNLSIERIKE
jgi:hypothetical protein